MVTVIQISDKLWEHLNKQKKPGETFEQVLLRNLQLNIETMEVKKCH